MPYKSEKIKIANTENDRRIKLSPDQKAYICWLRKEEHISYNKLAVMFGVSKRTIQFVCCPEKYEIVKEQFKKRSKEGRYKVTSEERNRIMREHRSYKNELYKAGKIK